MNASYKRGRVGGGWCLLAIVAMATFATASATAQTPKMYYGYPASAKGEADQKAITLARKEESAALKKGDPPAYPNPKPPRLTPEMVASLATLPQLGPGNSLLVAALSTPMGKNDPSAAAFTYEWAQLQKREMTLLDLDSKEAEAAAKKREAAGEVLVHPTYNLVITSRTTKEQGAPAFYMLVRQPAQTELISEAEFKDIRVDGDAFLIRFTATGQRRLAEMTKGAKPKSNRFVALIAEGKVMYAAEIAREINDGRVLLSPDADFELRELREIAATIRRLISTQ